MPIHIVTVRETVLNHKKCHITDNWFEFITVTMVLSQEERKDYSSRVRELCCGVGAASYPWWQFVVVLWWANWSLVIIFVGKHLLCQNELQGPRVFINDTKGCHSGL